MTNMILSDIDNTHCNHEKIYEEDILLLTNPPKAKWTCKKCGLHGYITLNQKVESVAWLKND